MAIIGTEMIEPILTDPTEDWVIAHELAHQWWGNAVTCADWSELWLNEGLTVFMVTHDLHSLHAVCDRVAALADAAQEHGYGTESDCVCGRNFAKVRGLREHITKMREGK